jgi:phosphopantothenoylcysteine synthetase/decarboxylase
MSEEKSNLKNANILLGVSGGIAAYKAVDLARKLTGAGAKLNTVMTASARRLIGPKSFEAVTGAQVFVSMWNKRERYDAGAASHIDLVDWADMVVVAPATANILGKIANGICDDLLSTILCVCWAKPTLLAPAMNNNMWNNPAVQRNVERLKEMGFRLAGPEEGLLVCGREGVGRMSEPSSILKTIEEMIAEIRRNEN